MRVSVTDANDITVIDNQSESRLEVQLDGRLAELIYHKNGKRLVLIHTEVPEVLGGHGIGGRLVQAAVDKAAASGATIVPLCPYARSWLERHPDEAAKVPIDWTKPAGA
jgi:predicted GNAT family acetyltransferase